MRTIKIELTGSVGVGKTNLVNNAIIPWANKNGFKVIQAGTTTLAAAEIAQREFDCVVIVERVR